MGDKDICVFVDRRGAGRMSVRVSGLAAGITQGWGYEENRTIAVSGGAFTDTLSQWGVHVYTSPARQQSIARPCPLGYDEVVTGRIAAAVALVLFGAGAGCSHSPARPRPPSPDAAVPDGDLWMCDCDCPDPVDPRSVFTVPLEGCGGFGQDRATACAHACYVRRGPCLGYAKCAINGGCQATPGGAGRIVAPRACRVEDDLVSGSERGSYHVTVDAGRSTLNIEAGDLTATRPLSGELWVDAIDGGGYLIADMIDLAVADFDAGGHHVGGMVLVTGELTALTLTSYSATAGQFFATPGRGVLVVRWREDGAPRGIEPVNHTPWTGSLDPATRRFVLDLSGSDDAASASVTAHIEGVVDDLPPVADAGPNQTVACASSAGTPVRLDSSASFDPDPGDALVHWQWSSALGVGESVDPEPLVMAPPGQTTYSLLVYDRRLGVGDATTTISVTGACPP